MTHCKTKIYLENGGVWRCPREVVTGDYCEVHEPQGLFRIKYTWTESPTRRVRYRMKERLTHKPEEASLFTYEEAYDIVTYRSRDAYLVWAIVTSMEHVS